MATQLQSVTAFRSYSATDIKDLEVELLRFAGNKKQGVCIQVKFNGQYFALDNKNAYAFVKIIQAALDEFGPNMEIDNGNSCN